MQFRKGRKGSSACVWVFFWVFACFIKLILFDKECLMAHLLCCQEPECFWVASSWVTAISYAPIEYVWWRGLCLYVYVCICAFVLCSSQSQTVSNFPSGSAYAEHEVSLSLWIYCKVCISLCVGVYVSVLLYQLDLTVSMLVSCCFI